MRDRGLRRRLDARELGLELRLAPRRRVRLGVDLDPIGAGRRDRLHLLGIRIDEDRGANAERLQARDDRRDHRRARAAAPSRDRS